VALALAAGLTLTSLTACVKKAPPPDPHAIFLAAFTKTNSQGYDVATATVGDTLEGHAAVNPQLRAASFNEQGTIQGSDVLIEATEIGTSFWVKTDLGDIGTSLNIDPTKWYLIDRSKLGGKQAKPFDVGGADPFDLAQLFAGVRSITYMSATELTGFVDLTAAKGVSAPDATDLSSSGDQATQVPFTMNLDPQGRITKLVVDGTNINPNLSQSYTFTNYGQPGPIQQPPAEQTVPAPAAVYAFLT
jgi:hypothetical protein